MQHNPNDVDPAVALVGSAEHYRTPRRKPGPPLRSTPVRIRMDRDQGFTPPTRERLRNMPDLDVASLTAAADYPTRNAALAEQNRRVRERAEHADVVRRIHRFAAKLREEKQMRERIYAFAREHRRPR